MKSAFILLSLVLSGAVPLPSSISQDGESTIVRSLLGTRLEIPEFEQDRRMRLTRQLEEAQKALKSDVDNVDNWIWVGRRLGYLWRYREAIDTFSQAIDRFPDEPKLYRHRGHRYITLRKFDKAISDLKKAADLIEGKPDEVEPDGMPNSAGIPTSTLHTNIWYHLGLACYLNRDYDSALKAYEKCLGASRNNDMKVATLDWMYMTLMRLDRRDQARKVIAEIDEYTPIIENFAYHKRLMMYRGLMKPADLLTSEAGRHADLDLATYGYGIGNWFQVNGDLERANQYYRRVVGGKYWAAFGYIAAEAELAAESRSDRQGVPNR